MCPNCQSKESKVVDTRFIAAGSAIRRRRECSRCHSRYTTYEMAIPRPLWVIKSNAKREHFRMDKLTESIRKAYGKAEVDEQVYRLAVLVLREIIGRGTDEVLSKDLGDSVERHLRTDPVPFVRYAALHRRYHTIDDIRRLLEEAELQAQAIAASRSAVEE